MALTERTRLGTYEIIGPLGAGAMGEVYRAKDLRLGRDIAIKVLSSEVASSPDRLARFEREARLIAGLNHPNIVTLHSVEDDGGVRFLTMELVEGRTLSTLVTPGGLSLPKLRDLALPLSDALAAAHDKGVIHRDLKPGNVMMTRDGRVKVLDFGLAKIAEGIGRSRGSASGTTASAPISGEGDVVGTIPYMAPEQIRGEVVDVRADLFSLGVVLYEMATGRRPFAGESTAEVSSSILRDTPVALQTIRGDLPRGLDRIVMRCLEKNPRDRFPSARDVYDELRHELERDEGSPSVALMTPDRSAANVPASGMVSIAVLPFVNRSADPDDEYFSDGLADELLNVLSKIQGLRVTARSSAFLFKGTKEDVPTIGRRLNVSTLLEGSVRKASNRIRVSVQLVNVSDSSHLWSQTYDRTMEDIFAVQDDIAQSVVKELRTALLGEEEDSDARGHAREDVAQAVKGRGTDPEAQRIYLLARHILDRWTREDTTKAIGFLKQALDRDPDHAFAWVELGVAYSREAGHGWTPVSYGYGRARDAVQRALASAPDLPEAHVLMGTILWYYDWDFGGAEVSFRRALEISPRNAEVLRLAGALTWNMGRLEEGIGLLRQALEQNPLGASAYHNLGFALQAAGRFAAAEEACRKALELAPHRALTRAGLSFALLELGRGDEALQEAMREPDEALRLWALAIVHQVLGQGADSDGALTGLIERHADAWAYQVAEVCAIRGEAERAFEWLERAYVQRDSGLTEMKSSPRLRSLHDDPRWSAFLSKMRLGD